MDNMSTLHWSAATSLKAPGNMKSPCFISALCSQTKSQDNLDFVEKQWKKMIGEEYEVNN